ncbi:hypothetical protein [Tolypothrix sp. NIES-4075]|nr:hypothetical protein [Tolypothrix sp. NIES-4075]
MRCSSMTTLNLSNLEIPGTLPVVGAECARKLLDPNLPSNALIDLASDRD